MSQRYEAVAVRRYEKDGEEKAAFTNIGVAWPMKDRDGYTVRLHAFPVPEDGEFVILLMPPKERDDQRQDRGPARRDERPSERSARSSHQRPVAQAPSFSRDMDDDIPFAPEWR
jgi:hypothetical protein